VALSRIIPQLVSEGEFMNLKDLISKVSAETSIPAAQARKVVNAVLETLRANVEAGEDFGSPRLNVRAMTIKATETVDDAGKKITFPEKKIGRMVPKEPKPKV
jgi:nucleoid DNA-binding protein